MDISVEQHTTVVGRLRTAGCVFAEDEAALLITAATDQDQLDTLLRRRVAGEPLEPLIGWVEFAGRRLYVAPGVFVPRRRTELLAAVSVAYAGPAAVVVELCCGIAPVAATVRAAYPTATLVAADIEPGAVACARRNLPDALVVLGDLYAGLSEDLRGRVDVLVANAPYVPTEQIAFMPPEARLYEPTVALDGGPDGTSVQQRVVAGARDWLAPGGRLLVESGRRQSMITAELFRTYGFEVEIRRDPEVEGTVVVGS